MSGHYGSGEWKRLSCLLLLISGCAKSPSIAGIFGDFSYEISGNGIVITDYPEDAIGEVEIPEEIDGKRVTSIGARAFADCRSISNMTMPESVTSIGERAFNQCFGMANINIPETITEIGPGAFHSCHTLMSVTLPNGISVIGDETFFSCNRLQTVTIPNSGLRIGSQAFTGCEALKTVDLPNSATTIAASAFFRCTGLTEVKFPLGLKSIEENVFGQCERLKTVTLPISLTDIGSYAFVECKRLRHVTIPAGVTSIGTRAFFGCTVLRYAYFLGAPPDLGAKVFAEIGNDPMFTILYPDSTAGFTSPLWNGYRSRNLSAHALNLDPQKSAASQMPTIEHHNGILSMKFYGAAVGVVYAVEVSEDFRTWTRRPDLLKEPDANGIRKVSVTTINSVADSQFLRLAFSIER